MKVDKKPYDFEGSFLRIQNGLQHLYPALSCFSWLSAFNPSKKPSRVHMLYPRPSPKGIEVEKAMRCLFIPALNQTRKHLLLWENLEPPTDESLKIQTTWHKKGYTRGFVLRAPLSETSYVGGWMAKGWNDSSFELLSKISFPFLEFFDIGIRQLQSTLCPKLS